MFKGSEYFYYVMYLVGFALMMVWNLKDHERYGIKKKDVVLYTLYTYVCGVVGAMIMGKIYTAVSAAAGVADGSRVAIFGAVIFTPFLLLLFPIKHRQWPQIMDLLTPGILLILACAKIGCFFNGCCRGVVCSFGVHYPDSAEKNFPIQILETLTMLLVLALTQLYIRKAKRFVTGTAYPITFAVYSVTRFGWEFLRYYPEERLRHFWLELTFWQVVCAATFLVCAAIIVAASVRARKQPVPAPTKKQKN